MNEAIWTLVGVALGGLIGAATKIVEVASNRRGQHEARIADAQLETAVALQSLIVRMRTSALTILDGQIQGRDTVTRADLREYMAIDAEVLILTTRLLSSDVRTQITELREAYYHAAIQGTFDHWNRTEGQHTYDYKPIDQILETLGRVIRVAGADPDRLSFKEKARTLAASAATIGRVSDELPLIVAGPLLLEFPTNLLRDVMNDALDRFTGWWRGRR